ncbi:MAG: SHOCT domain-containing protein [Pseudomonadota bacterium]
MIKRFLAVALISSLFLLTPFLSHAVKTTYIANNHRFDSVLLKEVSSKVAEERTMTQPVQLDRGTLRNILGAVTITKRNFGSKKIHTIHVFDGPALDFMTDSLDKAFAQATSFEEVQFSFLSKNPMIIIKNDRLTIGKAWIHENELHIKFSKLWAKVTMDTDKRGNERRAMQSAKGLRIKLNSAPGIIAVSDEYLIADLKSEFAAPGEDVEMDETTAAAVPVAATKDSKTTVASKSKKGSKKSAAAAEVSDETTSSGVKAPPEERLETLKKLKDKGFISDKEYFNKKQEILKEL